MKSALLYSIKALGYIPLFVLYWGADLLYYILKLIGYRKRVVTQNIKTSFPHKSEQEIEEIIRLSYKNFSDVLMESLKLKTLSRKKLQKRMRLLNPELLDELKAQNKGAILIGAHYNNWEWMALALSTYAKQEVYSVYKPLSNENIDALMLSARSRFGAHIIPMNAFPKTVLRNKNKSTINIMLADQSPHKSKVDFYCDFLNQDTPVYLGPEKLMKAADLALLFIEVHRVKRGFYEMKIVSLADKAPKEPGAATRLHVSHLEKLITDKPENWLWSHRRWKHSRKN